MKNFSEGSPGTRKKEFNSMRKSRHDLSHAVKCSTALGFLTPVLNLEVYPNDSLNIRTEIMARFEPLIWPIYHRLEISFDVFYASNNMLWPNPNGFNDFISKGTSDQTTIEWAYTSLYGDMMAWSFNNRNPRFIGEYLGIPSPTAQFGTTNLAIVQVNAMPFAMYWACYDEYYRYAEVQDTMFVHLSAGENTEYNHTSGGQRNQLVKVNWQRDYFTMCTPSPTYNGTDVLIPMNRTGTDTTAHKGPFQTLDSDTDVPIVSQNFSFGAHPWSGGTGGMRANTTFTDGTGGSDVYIDNQSIAGTIRDLRGAQALQQFYERLNRTTDRFNEFILGFFGTSPYPLQIDRPIHLGGKTSPIKISEVMQTASNWESSGPGTGATFTGEYTGQALGVQQASRPIRFTVPEHGWVQAYISVVPRSSYYQGLHKKWTRNTWMDYMFPDFAQIGDQAVYKKEIFFDWSNDETTNNEIFGYNPRFQELRGEWDTVAGAMRESAAGTEYGRDGYHLGRKFTRTAVPNLSDEFLKCDPREAEVFQQFNTDDDTVYLYVWHDIDIWRKMPKYSIPATL